MTDIIEAVARAIDPQTWYFIDAWDTTRKSLSPHLNYEKTVSLRQGRAAVIACLERTMKPNYKMIVAGRDALEARRTLYISNDDLESAFQAMLNAALKEIEK